MSLMPMITPLLGSQLHLFTGDPPVSVQLQVFRIAVPHICGLGSEVREMSLDHFRSRYI